MSPESTRPKRKDTTVASKHRQKKKSEAEDEESSKHYEAGTDSEYTESGEDNDEGSSKTPSKEV